MFKAKLARDRSTLAGVPHSTVPLSAGFRSQRSSWSLLGVDSVQISRGSGALTLPRSLRGGLMCLLCPAFFVPLKTCSRNAELLATFPFANDNAHVEDRSLSGGRSSPSALSPTHTRKSA